MLILSAEKFLNFENCDGCNRKNQNQDLEYDDYFELCEIDETSTIQFTDQ